jgi:hypothetical protein
LREYSELDPWLEIVLKLKQLRQLIDFGAANKRFAGLNRKMG